MTETSVVCLARLFIFSSITIKNAHPVNYLPVVWYSQRKEKRIFFCVSFYFNNFSVFLIIF